MSTGNIPLALMLMLGLWAGFRLGLWWSRRSLDTVIAQQVAKRGWQPSPEFLAMLRRPTVDGVARRTLRKMGLAAYADVLLGGTPITLVCHNKALLQRAVSAIIKEKDAIEGHMQQALHDAQADAVIASLKQGAGSKEPGVRIQEPAPDMLPDAEVSPEEMERRQVLRSAVAKSTEFHAPPLPEPKVPAQPFTVIEGGKK